MKGNQLFPQPQDVSVSLSKPDMDMDFSESSGRETKSNPAPTGRWRWWFGIMFTVAVVICLRLLDLQLARGQQYRQSAESNRKRIEIIPAPRGSILDRHGKVLAGNVPNFTLTIVPADLPAAGEQRQHVLSELAAISNTDPVEIQNRLDDFQGRAVDPAPVLEHLTTDQALQLLITTAHLPGVNVIPQPARQYPAGNVAGHILGYIGAISPSELAQYPELRMNSLIGKAGLEVVYESNLAGKDGRREIERDVHNQRHEVLLEQSPLIGDSLVLGLDLDLQMYVSERLQAMAKSLRAPGGAAIVMDPRSGSVLAMASEPAYDSNWFVDDRHQTKILDTLNDPRHPLLDRVLSGQYPSGSIIKPLITVAGLEEGLITPRTTVNSTGGIQIGRDRFPDWQAGGHGQTNLTKAIAESVNTFFYVLGGGYENREGLGVDRIVEYLGRFGWGGTLGIDLPNEADGLLPTQAWREQIRSTPWRLGDTYHLSIGQGDLQVTPLQVVTALSAIANGGTVYVPRLVTEIRHANGPIQTLAPKVLRNLRIQTSSLSPVREGLRQGVLSGSSRALQSLPVPAAGKTGTAEFGSAGKTHAWYAGYAPADDPAIAIAVIIESGGEGHAAALPVAKDIFNWYFMRERDN